MLAPTRAPVERPYSASTMRRTRFSPPPRRSRRVRRIAAIAAGICLVPALFSYIGALTAGLQRHARHPHRGVAARQRGARTGQPGRVDLLLAERTREGRTGAATRCRTRPGSWPGRSRGPQARPGLLPAAADPPGHPPGAARRGRLARHVRGRRRPSPGAGDELPQRPVVSADGRRRRLDRPQADHHLALSGSARARCAARVARADGGSDAPAGTAGRDLQQRLQAQGLRRRLRRGRTHLRADEAGPGHVRPLPRRPRRRDPVDRRAGRGAEHHLRAPEPPVDRQSRPARTRTSQTVRSGASRSATRSGSGARASASTATGT